MDYTHIGVQRPRIVIHHVGIAVPCLSYYFRKILGEYGDRITFSVGYKTGFSISNVMLMQSRGGGIARRFRANFDVPG